MYLAANSPTSRKHRLLCQWVYLKHIGCQPLLLQHWFGARLSRLLMCDKFINDVESRWMQVARTAWTVENERIKSES